MQTSVIIVAVLVSISIHITNVYGQLSRNLDNADVDMLLKNERVLNNYLKCLLDKGLVHLTDCNQRLKCYKTTLYQFI